MKPLEFHLKIDYKGIMFDSAVVQYDSIAKYFPASYPVHVLKIILASRINSISPISLIISA